MKYIVQLQFVLCVLCVSSSLFFIECLHDLRHKLLSSLATCRFTVTGTIEASLDPVSMKGLCWLSFVIMVHSYPQRIALYTARLQVVCDFQWCMLLNILYALILPCIIILYIMGIGEVKLIEYSVWGIVQWGRWNHHVILLTMSLMITTYVLPWYWYCVNYNTTYM